MKKETLEEAAENHVKMQYPMGVEKEYPINDFIAGAKWQAEQDKTKFSEEEVDVLIHELINKFTDWSGSYVYNDKLIEIYKQLKNK